MNAKETLKLLSKQWCTVNDIMRICNVGMNKAVEIKSKLKRFEDIKIRDFDIQEFLKWRTWISSIDLALKTKN